MARLRAPIVLSGFWHYIIRTIQDRSTFLSSGCKTKLMKKCPQCMQGSIRPR